MGWNNPRFFFFFFRVQGRLCERHAGPSPRIPPGKIAKQYLWRYCFLFPGCVCGTRRQSVSKWKKIKISVCGLGKGRWGVDFFLSFLLHAFRYSSSSVQWYPEISMSMPENTLLFPTLTPIIFLTLFQCKRFSLLSSSSSCAYICFNKSSFPPRAEEWGGEENYAPNIFSTTGRRRHSHCHKIKAIRPQQSHSGTRPTLSPYFAAKEQNWI